MFGRHCTPQWAISFASFRATQVKQPIWYNLVQILSDQTITFSDKYDSFSPDWQLVTDSGETDVYAAELNFNPEYYLIKLGTGNTNLNSHYLFENIGELSYAVINFSDAGLDFTTTSFNIGRISHVGEFGGTVDVPEPANLALFGLGIAALGLSRKKQKST